MDFRLLGALEVSAQGAVAELGPPKQRALLAILLLHAGEIVPIDRLIDLLWGEEPPRTANHSIQIYVSDLRKAIDALGEKEILTTRPPGYQLNADAASIDISQFEGLVEAGTRKLRAGDRAGGADDIRSALRLWRGPALSDFTYEEFAQPYIRRFHDLHLDAIEELAAAELEAGQAGEVVPMLDAAIREDPLRERSRELLMLALYRSGRHAEALRTYQQLRTQLVEELGLDPSPPLQRMQERILLHDPSLSPPPEAPAKSAPARNPYKGLRPFAESDAGDFFGRDDLVERLVGALRAGANLIALVGPSGSGKSSAMAAGLIPRLRGGAIPGSESWAIAQMVPGANPLAEVEAVVAAAATAPRGLAELLAAADDGAAPSLVTLPETGRVLLVIDQFEELFTLTDEPTRRRFLSAIAGAVAKPDTQITVLLALRADYYDRPLLHPEFARVFTPGVVNALPMTANELEAVVVGPADRSGVSVEPALLAELVADAADRPGTLPLLEYALTDLFDQRREAALTLEGYRALGGMRGVLSRSAEAVYGALNPDEQRVAMQVFLRLVQLGHGTTESRRRLPLADLTGLDLDPVALSRVLEKFGSRRLLSFDRDPATDQATVEVAHESLFREWDRLAGWIERHRVALQRYEALMGATDEWEASGRHTDYLLTGTRLAELEAWGEEGTLQLTGKQRAFLAAGLERRHAEEKLEQARTEGERQLVQRARRRLVALGVVVAVAVGAVGYGAWAGVFNQPMRVALVHTGVGEIDALGESGFDRAVSEFGLVGEEGIYPNAGPESVEGIRDLAASGVGLAFVTTGNWDSDTITHDFPRTDFYWPFPLEGYPNAAYANYPVHEGAYLAGVAAALKSTTGKLGFIGGYDAWFIWGWHAGFAAGAQSINPDIEITWSYLSGGDDFTGFHNASAAEVQARIMFGAGADVIFHAAGDSGVGVFEAASDLSTPERRLWAIGVDTDQYETVASISGAVHPDKWRAHILTSVIKRVDKGIYEAVARFARGEFQPGRLVFTLAEGDVDLSYSGGFIDDFRPQIEAARERIVSGQITVPCVPPEREDEPPSIGVPEGLCGG